MCASLRLPHGADLPLPAYQSEHAAGLDLLAAVASRRAVVLAPGAAPWCPTGIAIALPPDAKRRCGRVPGSPSAMG